MWIVHSSGSHAVAAPGAEIRVRELVRCHLRWIWTNWNALSSGFSLLLSWFKESTRPITQKHRVRTFALSMFQLGARQDLWNPRGSESSGPRVRGASTVSSIPSVSFLLLRHGFRFDSRNLQIAVHNTVVSTQLQPGHLCELVQNHA